MSVGSAGTGVVEGEYGGHDVWHPHRRSVSAQWRKAPFVLRHHPTVLLAVAAAAFLVALAAASSPFVRAAAGSVALKNKLDEFSAYTAGLQITTEEARPLRGLTSVDKALRAADGRDARVARLGRDLGFIAAPVTASLTPPISSTSKEGFTQLRLMARTDALATSRSSRRFAATGCGSPTSPPASSA